MGIQQSFNAVYPTQTSLNLTNVALHNGTKYAARMVLPCGSVGGLPDFVEVSQIVLVDDSLSSIVKMLNSWYDEHFGAFMLDHSWKIILVHHCELADAHPLTAYFEGGKHMVLTLTTQTKKQSDVRNLNGSSSSATDTTVDSQTDSTSVF